MPSLRSSGSGPEPTSGPEALLVAFGESVTEDDQLQVQLTVTSVTPALEGLVSRLPVGIVDVTALVHERSSAARQV
ncbi:hypothetical protein [Oerskovia sp. USHLN155]|uniref:hypothetical protein n=1 Tax=Oerskovia sp. USHLN155 TaxID=3081288 RepID=UPI00301A3C97